MEFTSGVKIGDVIFGCNEAEATAILGEPSERHISDECTELWYDDIVYRFDCHGLAECCFSVASGVTVNGVVVVASALIEYMKSLDSKVEYRYGFHVSHSLCFAVDSHDEENDVYGVTVFRNGYW